MIDTKGYTNSGTDGASDFSNEEHDGGSMATSACGTDDWGLT